MLISPIKALVAMPIKYRVCSKPKVGVARKRTLCAKKFLFAERVLCAQEQSEYIVALQLKLVIARSAIYVGGKILNDVCLFVVCDRL